MAGELVLPDPSSGAAYVHHHLLPLAFYLAVAASCQVVLADKNSAVETRPVAEQAHPRMRRTIMVNTRDSDGADAGLTGSQGRVTDPPMLGRKSVLIGMLTSGFVITNAAQSSDAIAGGTIKPIAATQPNDVPRWTPITVYVLGQQVVSPNNDVVSAKVAHISSATYDSDTPKWALSSTFGALVKPEQFGAKGDAKKITDAAMTSGSGVLTSATAVFVASDIGKVISVAGAGAALGGGGLGAGTTLLTTIASCQSATQVTLTADATATVSAKQSVYGTDDATAMSNAVASFRANTTDGLASVLTMTPGKVYLLGSPVIATGVSDLTVIGWGAQIQAHANASYPMFDLTNGARWTITGLRHDGGRMGAYRPFEYSNYGYVLEGSFAEFGLDHCEFSWFNDSCCKAEGENSSGGQPPAAISKNVRITNCRFTDVYHIAILGKYGTATGFVFANNLLMRVSGPVEIDGQALNTAYTTGSGSAVISNNVWTDCQGDPGVEGGLIFIEENGYDVIITGNVMRRVIDLVGLHLDDGQTFKSYGRISVTNNIFEEFQSSGTTVPVASCNVIQGRVKNAAGLSSLKDLSISGNKFINTAGAAIYFSQASTAGRCDNIRVVNNEFVDVGCWGVINAAGNDAVKVSLLAQFDNLRVSGNTFIRRGSALKSFSWLTLVGTPANTQGMTMVSDNSFKSPTDNDPRPVYLNGLNRLVAIGNTMESCSFRVDATSGSFQSNRMISAVLAVGVAVASPACNLTVVGNTFTKGAGATDYAMKLMQTAWVDGMANVLLGYTGNPIYVSSGTYKGQSMRENGVISVVTP